MNRAALRPVVLLAALGACAPSARGPAEAPVPPAVVMHGVRLRSFEGDAVSLRGRAERATYERTGELTASGATIEVPGQGPGEGPGRGSADVTRVTARELEGHVGTRQLVASGDVVVTHPSGLVAHTPRVSYDAGAQRARGDEGVQLQGPGYRLAAERFELELSTGLFSFEGSVKTVLEAAHD